MDDRKFASFFSSIKNLISLFDWIFTENKSLKWLYVSCGEATSGFTSSDSKDSSKLFLFKNESGIDLWLAKNVGNLNRTAWINKHGSFNPSKLPIISKSFLISFN